MLHVIGDWLKGSGWDEVLVKADVTTFGRAESFLMGSHVKRARYAHQVSVAALFIILKKAWEMYKASNQSGRLEFQQWV